MAFIDKIVDLFYLVKDKVEDKIDDINIDKKKLIMLIALVLALVILIVVICTTHGSKGNEETGLTGEEVGTTGDSDAWWKKFIPGESDDVNTGKTVAANEISWEPVEGAVGYNVYRATKEDGEYVCIAVVTETSYTDTTAKKGTKYYYKTTAVKATRTEEKDGTTVLVTEEVTMAPESIVTEKVTVTTTAAPTTEPLTNKDGEEITTQKSDETETTKKGDVTEDETTKKSEDKTTTTTKKVTTTTTTKPTTTTTTQRVIPSSGGTTTNSSKVNNALSQFNKYAATYGMTTKQLATYCGKASGVSSSVSSTTNIKGVSGTVSGYDECYKFTSDYSLINNARYFGYVFKVSEGTDPAAFADTLYANAVSRYSFTNIGSTAMSYKAVAYYDQFVFFMISAQT